MKRAFLALVWGISETRIHGPFDTAPDARSWAKDELEGGDDFERGAVLGPVPIDYLDEEDEADEVRTTWSVFETADANLEWMMQLGAKAAEADDAAAAFDNQPGQPGAFIWVGNYTGKVPADVYRQANDDRPLEDGRTYVAVPVGVFGPTDWMRKAGEALSAITG